MLGACLGSCGKEGAAVASGWAVETRELWAAYTVEWEWLPSVVGRIAGFLELGQSLRACIFLRVVQDAFRPLGFCPGPTEWGYLKNKPLCILSQAKPGPRSVRLCSFTLLKAPGPFQTEAFCTALLSLPAWAEI